jgi:O-antigen ligase
MTLGPLSSNAAGARRSLGARVAAPAIVAGGILVAVAMTAATAVAPPLGVLALAPLIVVPIVLGGPLVALAALAAALFVQFLPPFGLGTTALLVLVGALWVEARWGRPARARIVTAAPRAMAPAIVGLLLWLGLSIGWARHAGPGVVKLENWVVAAALFGVVTTTVRTPSHVLFVVRAFVAGAVVSVVVGLAAAVLAPGGALQLRTWAAERLQGGAADPNVLAAGLVAAIALAVGALATTRRGSRERRLLVAALVVLVAGLGATQSRGGVIAAVAATATAIALAPGRRVRGVLGAGAVAALLVAALAASPGGLARVATPDAEGDGRADLWRVAARMVHTDPVLGVGLANFPVRSPDFVQAPGALHFAELIAERPHDVHNTYLQLLAEVGLPGLLAYLTVVGLALSTAWRAQRRLAALGEPELASLARSVLVAAVGMLVALVFLTDGDDMRLWILLGLGPALLGTAVGRTGRSADRLTRASGRRSAP